MLKQKLQHKVDFKSKPIGSLGKLEAIAIKLGLIQNTLNPQIMHPTHIVFAADHGLSEAGVSPYPKEVTYQMVYNFLNGGAAINVFCRQHQINLKLVDAGVDHDFPDVPQLISAKMGKGTNNILLKPSMDIDTCNKCLKKGAQILDTEYHKGCNTISFGEMGIGNTASASLLMHKYTGNTIENCTGRGAGHDEEGLKKKIYILEKASAMYPNTDPLSTLATFGGFEISMICGAIMQAHKRGMCILIDGFIVTSALLAAYSLNNSVLDNCIFCHCSDEKGHRFLLEYLNADPLLNLDLRLGEGTGAILAFPLIQSAVLFLNEMASFDSAGVSNKN